MDNDTFHPKVSIVIPVYNGSNYLAEAIDSALAQTYDNIEIIVVNDGSTDNGATEQVAKSYSNKIRYFAKENGGVATALNFGIEKMKGEYFSWLSHDDMYKSKKIQTQINFLSNLSDRDNVILYSNYDLMNEHGQKTGTCKLNHSMLEKTQIYALLRGSVNGITMLIPKSAFVKYGKFDVGLRCTQDYDMWFRMIKTYRFAHMNDSLSITRIHSLQDTQANPRAISEGNTLWIDMVNGLSDARKTEIEGSLFKFYLEMIKFVRQTPYTEALDYIAIKLEEAAQTVIVDSEQTTSIDNLRSIYDELVELNQKRALAFYFETIIRQLTRQGAYDVVSNILLDMFIGIDTGLNASIVSKEYVSQIAEKPTKPRLMFCTGHWLTGGMERVLSNLFKQIHKDYDLYLLTAYDGRQGVIELPDYVNHIKISNELFYDAYSQTALVHALSLNIDVVIGFMNLFNGQLDFYELSKNTRLKTIASNNEMYFYPYHNPYYYGLIDRRIDIFKSLDATLWSTNFSAAAYGLVANNSYLMPNPNSYNIQTTKNQNNEQIILCVGRFNDYVKRVDRILRCFAIVSRRIPNAKLVLVGKYDLNAPIEPESKTTLGEFISELRIDTNKIKFVGEVANVSDYYKKAKVLLVTSMSEGFGMVISEAACFGVPTVCNTIPGLEDLIIDGKNGFLVPQNDIDLLAEKVGSILDDKNLWSTMSTYAKKHVTKFDETKIANRWIFLIDIVLSKKQNKESMLNEKLAYSVKEYKEYSKLIFSELNGVITINHNDRLALLTPKYESTLSFVSKKAKSKYTRLNKSLKTNGILFTGRLVAKKTYHKAKRIYK